MIEENEDGYWLELGSDLYLIEKDEKQTIYLNGCELAEGEFTTALKAIVLQLKALENLEIKFKDDELN